MATLNVKGEAGINGNPVSPRTVSVTVVSRPNRIAIGVLYGSGNHGVTSATFGGNTCQSLGVISTGSGRPLELFAIKGDTSIPTGNQVFSAAYSVLPQVSGVGVWVFDGAVDWKSFTTNSGTTSPSTISIPSDNGNIVCAAEIDDNSAGRTIIEGVSDWTQTAFDGNYLGSHINSAGRPTVLSWTNTGVSWVMAGVDIVNFVPFVNAIGRKSKLKPAPFKPGSPRGRF